MPVKTVMKIFKKRLNIALVMAACLMLLNITALAQIKVKSGKNTESPHLAAFKRIASQAGVDFMLPDGFKEIKAINNENFSIDYAMAMPGKDFEIWIQVKSLKENWSSYEALKNIRGRQLANPDSLYKDISSAYALQLCSGSRYYSRNITAQVLEQYNADAGKTYFLSLADLPETSNYKYALLIALQKNHIGTVLAICLTNDKGPDFFKIIKQAQNCLKFK
jgi:hypothetical protein